MTNYGLKLKFFRNKAGLTLAQASDMIGISLSSLENYELNKKPIPISVFVKLANLYNFDVYDVLGVHEPQRISNSGLQLDLSQYDLIKAHYKFIVSRERETDKALGNILPEAYYNNRLAQHIQRDISRPLIARAFPELKKSFENDDELR